MKERGNMLSNDIFILSLNINKGAEMSIRIIEKAIISSYIYRFMYQEEEVGYDLDDMLEVFTDKFNIWLVKQLKKIEDKYGKINLELFIDKIGKALEGSKWEDEFLDVLIQGYISSGQVIKYIDYLDEQKILKQAVKLHKEFIKKIGA